MGTEEATRLRDEVLALDILQFLGAKRARVSLIFCQA